MAHSDIIVTISCKDYVIYTGFLNAKHKNFAVVVTVIVIHILNFFNSGLPVLEYVQVRINIFIFAVKAYQNIVALVELRFAHNSIKQTAIKAVQNAVFSSAELTVKA